MRLLDRYLLRELLIPLGYCLAGILIFWISFDLISDLDEFQQRQLLVRDLVEYYLVRMPELLVTIIPVTLLLALLYALTNHARHQELTAIRAAGVSLWRTTVPYLAVGFFCVGLLFLLNELWVPDSTEAANRVLTRRQPTGSGELDPRWQRQLTFHNERDQRLWNIGAFNRETGEMLFPNLDEQLPGGERRRLSAQRAVYTNGVWAFFDVKELTFIPRPKPEWQSFRTNALVRSDLTETPDQIRSEIKFSELTNIKAAKRPRLSLQEITDYRRLHPHLSSRDRFRLETQFHGRLAEPWTCLVVVLIALPFGAPSGRRNVFVGVASSIFIGFSYFILLRFSLAFGTGGYVPAWLAAWLPNILFGAVGIWLTQRVR